MIKVNDERARASSGVSAHVIEGLESRFRTRLYGGMAREVERKFLVNGNGWREHAGPGVAMRQFYLVSDADRSLRVRLKPDGEALLTMKFGAQARVRDEFEYPIPLAEAREMERFALGTVVEKVRHPVVHDGHVFEVDEFSGALFGLVIAELETPEEVPDASLPPWLGREITGVSAYYNATLALRGFPSEAA